MNDPKAAAAYHPGDTAVTRPDLDAIRARADAATPGPWAIVERNGDPIRRKLRGADDQFILGLAALLYPDPADASFITHAREDVPDLLAALAAERARADQAERDVTNAENDGIRWMKRAQEAEHRIADALSCLRASSVPLGMTEVMFQDRLITEARRVLSVAPTAEQ